MTFEKEILPSRLHHLLINTSAIRPTDMMIIVTFYDEKNSVEWGADEFFSFYIKRLYLVGRTLVKIDDYVNSTSVSYHRFIFLLLRQSNVFTFKKNSFICFLLSLSLVFCLSSVTFVTQQSFQTVLSMEKVMWALHNRKKRLHNMFTDIQLKFLLKTLKHAARFFLCSPFLY